jgi:hypothetical protein
VIFVVLYNNRMKIYCRRWDAKIAENQDGVHNFTLPIDCLYLKFLNINGWFPLHSFRGPIIFDVIGLTKWASCNRNQIYHNCIKYLNFIMAAYFFRFTTNVLFTTGHLRPPLMWNFCINGWFSTTISLLWRSEWY